MHLFRNLICHALALLEWLHLGVHRPLLEQYTPLLLKRSSTWSFGNPYLPESKFGPVGMTHDSVSPKGLCVGS